MLRISPLIAHKKTQQVPETRGKTLEAIAADLGSVAPPGSRNVGGGRGEARHVPLVNSEEEEELE